MNLFCVGLNHRTANVQTREVFAGHAETPRVLRAGGACAEALVLTTCNRVEVYGASQDPVSTDAIAHSLLAPAATAALPDDGVFYRYDGVDCIRHLFRVASGLDSMVVGETEILGQTKRAYELARQTGGAGPLLHRLFQRSFRVAKQVRTRTEITRGSVSVGSVAVDLAEKIFGDLRGRTVLLIGAGDTSEKTARALHSRGVAQLRVTNRSIERAQELAAQWSGRAVPFGTWASECSDVDIVISSTSAPEPLLTREIVAPIVARRLDRPLFIIDIAVPRDVAPDVNELESVYLYDIDSLQMIAEQSLAMRRQAVVEAEAIIGEHVAAVGDEIARFTSAMPSDQDCRGNVPVGGLRTSES